MEVEDWSIIIAGSLIILGLILSIELTSKRKYINLSVHIIILSAYMSRVLYGIQYESSGGGSGFIWGVLWFVSFLAHLLVLIIQLIINLILTKKKRRNETQNSNVEIIDDLD